MMRRSGLRSILFLLLPAVFAHVVGCATESEPAGSAGEQSTNRSEAGHDADSDAEQRKAEAVMAHVRAARDFQMEQRYDKATEELDKALVLDPDNPVLIGFKEMIKDVTIELQSSHLSRDVKKATPELLAIEKQTPYSDILSSSVGSWPELTALRLRGLDHDNDEAEANRAAKAALNKPLTLNHDNLSLEQVISFLRDSTGANIAVNWPALELVAIDEDSRVSISLRQVPAEQLLSLTLAKVSADAFDDDKAGFAITDGVIKISTLRDLKTETETRVYDIHNILDLIPRVYTRAEAVEMVVELVQMTVGDPDEWLDEESTLTELNGRLIVKTNNNNHIELVDLFASLRSPIGPAQVKAELKKPDGKQPLDKAISLSNNNLSLDQVITFIRDSTETNIDVNWVALEVVGIDQDSLVSVELKEVPAEQLLRLVLAQVSADAFDDDKAGFLVRDSVVLVSTQRDLKIQTESRVYSVNDLVGKGRDRYEQIEQLTELIQCCIGDPDEWLDEESTLTELNGSLIIRTTQKNHIEIMRLLTKIRTPIDPTGVIAAIAKLDLQEKTKKPLDKATGLRFDNTPLDQALAAIRDATGVNLFVNWPALELVGIDPDTLVFVGLNNGSGEELLRLVLEQVSADAFDDDKAGFAVRDGIVHISTLRDLRSDSNEIHTYNISDLLRVRDREERADRIIELFHTMVGDPDEWLDEESFAIIVDTTLIVRTTPENQRAVLELILKMRRVGR